MAPLLREKHCFAPRGVLGINGAAAILIEGVEGLRQKNDSTNDESINSPSSVTLEKAGSGDEKPGSPPSKKHIVLVCEHDFCHVFEGDWQ